MNKAHSKKNTGGGCAPLQSVLVYITSPSSSLTHISCKSKDKRANSAGAHHVSRLGFTPLVLLSAVLNGSPGASRLSRTDG